MFYSTQLRRLEKQMTALTDKIDQLTKQVAANSAVTSALISHFSAVTKPVDDTASIAAVQGAIDSLVASTAIMQNVLTPPPVLVDVVAPPAIPTTKSSF